MYTRGDGHHLQVSQYITLSFTLSVPPPILTPPIVSPYRRLVRATPSTECYTPKLSYHRSFGSPARFTSIVITLFSGSLLIRGTAPSYVRTGVTIARAEHCKKSLSTFHECSGGPQFPWLFGGSAFQVRAGGWHDRATVYNQ